MPKFKLCVNWTMSAEIEVEADNYEEAKQKAHDNPNLPEDEDSEYIHGSFEVIEEVSDFLNDKDADQKDPDELAEGPEDLCDCDECMLYGTHDDL